MPPAAPNSPPPSQPGSPRTSPRAVTVAMLHASDAPSRFRPPLVDAARARACVRLIAFDGAADPPAPDPDSGLDRDPGDCDALVCLPPFRAAAFRHLVERGVASGRLRWIHSIFTGVETMLGEDWFAAATEGIPLTNSRGAAGPALSEWVLMAMLYFCKDIARVRAAQRERRWEPFLLPEIVEQRVGILGLGGIGRAVARKCVAIGVPPDAVWGIKRDPSARPADLPGGVRVGGMRDLDALLATSDYVVSALPDAAETRGVLDARAIAAIKPGAVVINVGRGTVLHERALAGAVASGALAGAALDVFHTEPLPADSPLWGCDRVIVSPHTADKTRSFARGSIGSFADNLDRFLRGDALVNVVDKQHGY